MTHEIGTCLWFDNNALEASKFYQSTFSDFQMLSENPLAVVYKLMGRRFMHLNGGPGYAINPSISFFVNIDSVDEIKSTWDKLIEGGKVLMPLNKYPWSEQYGWCADKYGVNWQLMFGHNSSAKLIPNLMFVQNNNGKAKEAIDYYTKLFTNSSIISTSAYEKGEPDIEGNLKYAQFTLNGLPFCAMDSSAPHEFNFSEAVSFVLTVDTQEEIDTHWDYLVKEGKPGRCGWLKDKYGVSWQIVPSVIGKYMTNPATAPKASYAFLQMSKFIIADLEKAVEN